MVAANSIRQALPPGCGTLADQLDRAAVSIALNIAEGAGELAVRETARSYRIARRSATESPAILDVVRRLNLGPPAEVETAKVMLREIVPMLVRVAKRIEPAPSIPRRALTAAFDQRGNRTSRRRITRSMFGSPHLHPSGSERRRGGLEQQLSSAPS